MTNSTNHFRFLMSTCPPSMVIQHSKSISSSKRSKVTFVLVHEIALVPFCGLFSNFFIIFLSRSLIVHFVCFYYFTSDYILTTYDFACVLTIACLVVEPNSGKPISKLHNCTKQKNPIHFVRLSGAFFFGCRCYCLLCLNAFLNED